jgi:Kdo2-lipid IVA lauroyltransferase/acyltransferase
MTNPRPTPRWLRRALLALGAVVAWLAWTLRIRRVVVLDNLRLAFPERSEAERRAIARATYRNLGRMAAEFLLLRRLGREELDRIFVYEGWERFEAARALGKGVIACTAHFGNFEVLAAAHNLRGVPITIISRKMGRGRANDLWRRTRARAGVEDLVVEKGETLGAARRALARGRVLGYVIDQNQPLRRVIFALAIPLGDGRHRVVIEGPLRLEATGDRRRDVLAFMQDLNDRLERRVRAHPEQWYWLHRRWKTRPGGADPARPRRSLGLLGR